MAERNLHHLTGHDRGLPILQATDQAVAHSGYVWQDAEPYAPCVLRVKSVDTSERPNLFWLRWGLRISHPSDCRCADVHPVDMGPAREQNAPFRALE
jgi:hypothetical protein